MQLHVLLQNWAEVYPCRETKGLETSYTLAQICVIICSIELRTSVPRCAINAFSSHWSIKSRLILVFEWMQGIEMRASR
jgi:hypothetical protein